MPYYDDNSDNKFNWTAHKILTTPTGAERKFAAAPSGPFWQGVGSVAFLSVLGFVAGMAVGQGEIVAGLAGAAILAVIAVVVKTAFGRSDGSRPRSIRFGAIGAVVGFAAAFGGAFVGVKFVVMDGIVLGAVAGAVLGLFLRD